MKNRLISGIAFLILGLLIALGPQFLFPVCALMGGSYGSCHWTARAELALGAVIAAVGILLALTADKQIRLGLSLSLLLLAIPVLLTPTVLIGVCKMETMSCRYGALPALAILSVITFVGAGVNSLYLFKTRPKSNE